MPISNETYVEYMEAISEKDKSSLEASQTIINDLLQNINEAATELDAFRNELPALNNRLNMTAARTQIENIYNQLQSFSQQFTYLKSSNQTMISDYTPVTPA